MPPITKSPGRLRFGPRAALAAFLAAYLGVTHLFLAANTEPPTWDEALYLANSEIVFQTLKGNHEYSSRYYGMDENAACYICSFLSRLMGGVHTPLIALWPIPGYALLGTGLAGMTATYSSWIILFAVVYYGLVARLTDEWTAFVAVAVTSTMPLTVGLSRRFFMEYGLMMLVVLWLYLQLLSQGFSDRRFAVPLGMVLGLGLLQKILFPIFIAGPAVLEALRSVRADGSRARLVSLLTTGLIIAASAVLVSGIWYIPNFETIVKHGLGSATAQAYGPGAVWDLHTLLAYWLGLINYGVGTYYAFAGLLLGMLVWMGARADRQRAVTLPGRRISGHGHALILTWLLVPFAMFSFSVNKDVRFFLPALPAAGFVVAYLGLSAFRRAKPGLAGIPILLAFPSLLLLYVSLPLGGRVDWQASVGGSALTIFSPQMGYAYQPVQEAWPLAEILYSIQADIRGRPRQTRWIGVVPSHRYFNENTFLYMAVHHGYDFLFTGVHPAAGTELETQALLPSVDYLVTKTGDQGFPGAYDAEITPLLLRRGLAFVEIASFPLPDGSSALVFRKVE